MLRYSRGHMEILNRPKLEQCACECYGVVKKQYDRLLVAEHPGCDRAPCLLFALMSSTFPRRLVEDRRSERPLSRMGYHLWSLAVSRSGLNRSAMASRALKMRDLTVPMGQFMIAAISS